MHIPILINWDLEIVPCIFEVSLTQGVLIRVLLYIKHSLKDKYITFAYLPWTR